MFPLGHLAVGYLCYLAVTVVRHLRGRPVAFPPASLAVLAVATQAPDLIDKPLAYAGVLASGRSLGHSLLFVAALVVLVGVLARRVDRPEVTPVVAIGLVSHVLADSYRLLLAGEWSEARYLLYPLTDPLVYPGDGTPPLARILSHYASMGVTAETVAVALAAVGVVWHVRRARRSRRPSR